MSNVCFFFYFSIALSLSYQSNSTHLSSDDVFSTVGFELPELTELWGFCFPRLMRHEIRIEALN